MKKVKFRLRNSNWLRLVILIVALAFFGAAAFMFLKGEYVSTACFAVGGIAVFCGIIATYRLGIKITPDEYKFVCNARRRKFKAETVREIKMYFVKNRKRYGVYVEVYTKDRLDPIEFYWLDVRSVIKNKVSRSKVTDKNIYELISALNEDPVIKAKYII